MSATHYTAEEIIRRMESGLPTIEQWRSRWSELFNERLVPVLVWRLQCLDLMQRAQFQLTYTRRQMLNCTGCGLKRPQQGSGIWFVLGARRRVCRVCAKRIDLAKRR